MDLTDKEKDRLELQKKMEEFFARGGKIEICPPGARSEDIEYKHKFARGRKKKKKEE